MDSIKAQALSARTRRSRQRLACVLAAAAALHTGAAFVGSSAAPPLAVHSRSRGQVALYADNLFDRFTRVVKSNINQVLSSVEDPEKVLAQAVEEMQGDLIKVRTSYAEVLATQRRLQTQKDQQDEIAGEWYRRAELAVEKGDDVLAKEALTRRQAAATKASDLGQQLTGMATSVERLFDAVKSLEEKIQSAKDEKEQLIARARTAKTTAQVNEMLGDVGSSSGAGAFDRMKEKVEMLETKAEVSQGMLPESRTPGSLEDRFKQLESGSKVDDELAMLKGKKSLPAGGSSSAGGGGSELDKELEAMRKKLKDGADQ
jgi:phage shock protein A